MRTLVLVGGVSGSGKTTLTDMISAVAADSVNIKTFSTDEYFGEDYDFDVTKLSAAHQWNQDRTRAALEEGCNLVMVHNTFCSDWETEAYREMASELDYKVVSIIMNPVELFDDVHGIPSAVKQNQGTKLVNMFQSRLS